MLTKNSKSRPNHSSGGDAVAVFDRYWSYESIWGDKMEPIAGMLGQIYVATGESWPNRSRRVELMVGLLNRIRIATARSSRTGHPSGLRRDEIIV